MRNCLSPFHCVCFCFSDVLLRSVPCVFVWVLWVRLHLPSFSLFSSCLWSVVSFRFLHLYLFFSFFYSSFFLSQLSLFFSPFTQFLSVLLVSLRFHPFSHADLRFFGFLPSLSPLTQMASLRSLRQRGGDLPRDVQ